jgi:selenocysteine-specific elongation factor
MTRKSATHYKPDETRSNTAGAENEPLTLGVIGHVDHGKTALVRALTGIETDRLREEKERGLSIVLGFSYLEIGGSVVDLIDVPGHEDFVRAMISGATSIDGVILIVAANEGIMPQTREHFDIACLLGVERGLVVITKVDLVSSDEIVRLRAELRTFLEGSFLEDATIVEASSVTGQGIDRIGLELGVLRSEPIIRQQEGAFFLPLDRVFTMKGFGAVGTGTLRVGSIAKGERVDILPSGKSATVRGLQTHNAAVERASPGQRVAVNLRGIDRAEIRRGDTLATAGFLRPTRRIDVELEVLGHHGHPVKNRSTVRFLVGTSEAMATLRLLDRKALAPGEKGLVQLRLDRDIATHKSERFLIRQVSPMRTIGGGRILDVNPERHRRFDASVRRRLEGAAGDDLSAIAMAKLSDAALEGLSLSDTARETGSTVETLLNALEDGEYVAVTSDRIVDAEWFAGLCETILEIVAEFHKTTPHSQGIPSASVGDQIDPRPDPDVLRFALDTLCKEGELVRQDVIVRLASFDPFENLDAQARTRAEVIESGFETAGLETPSVGAVLGGAKQDAELFKLLLELGRLVRLRTYDRSTELVLHASTLVAIQDRIAKKFPYPAQFALKDIRDLLGSTRKYVVPLMEHFDATGFTIRMGNMRQLRKR